MKSFRGFIVLLLSFFCSIMAHAQKEYNGVMTRTSPHGTLNKSLMTVSIKKIGLFWSCLLTLSMLSSCIPGCDWGTLLIFKNCTQDTLFIGASQYNNIDSVDCQLFPDYNKLANNSLDTTGTSLWKNIEKPYGKGFVYIKFWKDGYIYPDSTCTIKENRLFEDNDTCFFFLVKWKDAKQYSWDEIRAKKLYRRWVTVKNKDGDCDRNIRY